MNETRFVVLAPWFLLLILAPVSAARAQTVPPALIVQDEKGSVPLGLSKLDVQVRIMGLIADTTTTMTFTNPTPRVMEGDLYFPLPEGATVSAYALDIQGKMVDGVAVEKHEARQVFESVVRRGIDPGLVEWTKGNNFKTRVFPIPARGSRTVRVEYLTELIGGKDGPAYHLPLNFKDKLDEFSLRVEVVRPGAPPKLAKTGLANFSFAEWQDGFVAETKLQNVTMAEDLVVALPEVDRRQVLVEKDDEGQHFFVVHDTPEVPRETGPAAAPKHVVLCWDASGSRGAADHKREIGLVKAYFEAQGRAVEAAGHEIAVDLIPVRNAASEPKRIAVRGGDPSRLVSELQSVAYDGGTQLAAISPSGKLPRPDFYMLFTDGLSNFGSEEPKGLDAPVYVFSADPAANHAFLQGLALTTGGRYFNLGRLTDADVLPAIGRAAYSFLSASMEGGEAGSLVPQLPQPVAGRFTLVGKLSGDRATVTVQYGVKGLPQQTRTFQVSRAEAVPGSTLRRFWAQKKLADLLVFQKQNEKEIVALGKKYGLVTPYTSLLVLDSLEQYVEHEIAPPKSLAAMRDEYMRRIDTIEHQRRKQKGDKLAGVIKMWEDRVRWWNTEFKYEKDFKYAAGGEKSERGGVAGGRAYGARKSAKGAKKPASAGSDSTMREEARPAEAPAPRPEAKAAEPAPAAASPSAPGMMPARREAEAAPLDANVRLLDQSMRPLGGFVPEVYDAAGRRKAASKPSSRQPGIVIKPWEPDTPYLKELRAAKADDRFAVYMKNRAGYGNSPAFFLDCADFFREQGLPELALQVLSNVAELQLEDASLLRVLGYRLLQLGYLDLAAQTFQQVLDLRPEEPQSYRDLALTLARRAEKTAAERNAPSGAQPGQGEGLREIDESVRADYSRAIDLWIQIVLKRWDNRFPEIELIALEELNHVVPKAKAAGVSDIPLDPRLIRLLDVDIRIVMTWHADATDIDLWVTEPSGEKAFYSHNRTTIGGLVSRDFTGGYGPEEYMVRRAANGMYKIEANYYGSRATRLIGAVTVQVDVFTNFGRPTESHKSLTVRLKEAKETVLIGQIEF